jgi:cobalamin transport system substrate-binding protein
VNITDDLGYTVKVPVPVRRIVSLAPGETEIVGALGRSDLLVGRCSACSWPPEVLNVPVVGGEQTYRVETVMARDPDLILATPREEPTGLDELRRNGYAVLVFAPETIDGIYRNIRTVGQAIGEDQNASRVVAGLQMQEKEIREVNRNLSKVRAIYVLHDDPLYVAGNLTYENTLITAAGGVNLMAGGNGYLMAAEESMVRYNPDTILVPADSPVTGTTLAGRIATRPAFANLTAVRNDRICAIDPSITHWPSPRVIQGIQLISDCLHSSG